jgi:GT2 family glycosyltransferase
MNYPSISVIIPSYGREDALFNTLKDLLSQTYQPNEIIVILQRPNQASSSLIQIEKLCNQRTILIEKVNFANAQKARNLAISIAKSEILLFLDDDVRFSPNLLVAHLENYKNDPTIDGVVGQILNVDQKETSFLPRSYYWPHLGWQNFPLNYSQRSSTENWPSTNSCIKRSLALKIGGFDEQFERTWFDDSDFSKRLADIGAKLTYDPTASITHLRVPLGGKRPASKPLMFLDAEGWGTYFYFWRKNYDLWKARYPFISTLRWYVFRKKLLIHPYWLFMNFVAVLNGWCLSSSKIAEGPKYGKFRDSL